MSRRTKAPIKDTRLQCPYCGSKTWDRNYTAFMDDHDRPHGGRCLRARRLVTNAALQELCRLVNGGGS